jgi:hypothetical protein
VSHAEPVVMLTLVGAVVQTSAIDLEFCKQVEVGWWLLGIQDRDT